MFGHTFELIIVLLVGLLIFGPKRVIEMGSAAGKMLRELRDAMKEMNWSALNGGEDQGSNPLAELRDLPRTFASSILNPPPATVEPPVAPTPAPTPPAAAESPDTPAETLPAPPASPTPSVEAESATQQAQSGSAPTER